MIDLLKWIWEQFEVYIFPFVIIHTYEKGVRLTWGQNPKLLEPGLRFKFPFSQVILCENVMPNTVCTRAIHATTSDGKTIAVEAAFEYEITDIVSWLISVNEPHSNLLDLARGAVADYVSDISWEETKKKTTLTTIKNKLNKRVEEFGCRVSSVWFTSNCVTRVIITQI